MNDVLLEHLLQDTKDSFSYPPPKLVETFLKDPRRNRNLSQGDIPTATAEYYVNILRNILLKFADQALSNVDTLGLKTELEMQSEMNNALQGTFLEAQGLLTRELKNWEWGLMPAREVLDHGQSEIRNQLHRKIMLRNPKTGVPPQNSINIVGSHNVNVVQGFLNNSIQQIISKGGPDEQIGQLLQGLVQIVEKLDKHYLAEQQELLRLIKGLVKEIETPQADRNLSTIQAVLERIQKVAGTIPGATELFHFLNEKVPELLRLLGFDF